jgi:hypothetical protein
MLAATGCTRDTAGRYTLIDMHVPPGDGPQPHRHAVEEMFVRVESLAARFRTASARQRRTTPP